MKSILKSIVGVLLLTSFAVMAAPTNGWRKEMSLDGRTTHYVVGDFRGVALDIQCGSDPATMTFIAGGRNYANDTGHDFTMLIGKDTLNPSDAGSSAGGDNFRYVWDAIRAGKKIVVKAGKNTIVLPVTGASKVLPPLAKSPCETW